MKAETEVEAEGEAEVKAEAAGSAAGEQEEKSAEPANAEDTGLVAIHGGCVAQLEQDLSTEGSTSDVAEKVAEDSSSSSDTEFVAMHGGCAAQLVPPEPKREEKAECPEDAGGSQAAASREGTARPDARGQGPREESRTNQQEAKTVAEELSRAEELRGAAEPAAEEQKVESLRTSRRWGR